MVRNYKSLEKIDLGLKKFNVLVGPNNSGKSNLIEAIMVLSDAIRGGHHNALDKRGGIKKVIFHGHKEPVPIFIKGVLLKNNYRWEYQVNYDVNGNCEEKGGASGARELVQSTHWRQFRFIPSLMRPPRDIRQEYSLQIEGGNISTVLHAIYNSRHKSFEQIENLLKAAVNEVEYISTRIIGDRMTQLAIKERYFDEEFPADVLSDGTLSLIAHLVALHGPEAPSLVCFEESENFVHPHIIEHLIDIMKKSPAQIIISTHSPTFLNYVEPEDIIIVSKVEGRTNCQRLKDLERYRDKPLGDLWVTGEFGGIP